MRLSDRHQGFKHLLRVLAERRRHFYPAQGPAAVITVGSVVNLMPVEYPHGVGFAFHRFLSF